MPKPKERFVDDGEKYMDITITSTDEFFVLGYDAGLRGEEPPKGLLEREMSSWLEGWAIGKEERDAK